MTWEEAIKYCEAHECKDCVAYNIADCRTEYEKQVLHMPCCVNLVDEELIEWVKDQQKINEKYQLETRLSGAVMDPNVAALDCSHLTEEHLNAILAEMHEIYD